MSLGGGVGVCHRRLCCGMSSPVVVLWHVTVVCGGGGVICNRGLWWYCGMSPSSEMVWPLSSGGASQLSRVVHWCQSSEVVVVMCVTVQKSIIQYQKTHYTG